jgi:selenocysteine lyase/cysteine desulfurase
VGFGNGNRFTQRWMISACNQFSPYFALKDLLVYWKSRGPGKIRKKLYQNQYYLEDLLDQHVGWKRFSPERGPHRGPLLSYHLPTTLSKLGWELMHRLYKEYGVQVVTPPIRGEFKMRFAPHIFNSEKEMKKAVHAIVNILR